MLKIRTVRTKSGKTAVQVVTYETNKTNVVKHIGSAGSEEELKSLKEAAGEYINNNLAIQPLNFDSSELFSVDNLLSRLDVTETKHNFSYEILSKVYDINGFSIIDNSVLKDLAIMRIIEPASKMRSIELLEEYFGINYSEGTINRCIKRIYLDKDKIEKAAVEYAKKNLSFDFSIVFYDVTTLYFESFKADDLRKNGYSKDGKPQQPQIVIGLVVTSEGYPISIQWFEGSKFEGHTVIPVILDLKEKYHLSTFTVVADAGMLSFDNIEEIKKNGLSYIVGARIKKLKEGMISKVIQDLNYEEGRYSLQNAAYGTLICDYSKKRASKDKSDREKQITKAKAYLDGGSMPSKAPKYLKMETKSKYKLNEELIRHSAKFDGIKGYYTNLDTDKISVSLIIQRYHDLWHIEKSFRISKSDLSARPIFHRKEEAIKSHILIVFAALCIAKSIELQTGYSIKKVRDALWKIEDITLVDKVTGKSAVKRMNYIANPIVSKVVSIFSHYTH